MAPAQTVKLTMIATDRANHQVGDVRQEDVQVFSDKLSQAVSLFSRDVRPVDYALVVDNSGSFRDLMTPVIQAATLIVNGNTPADETFIERFISSDKVETVQDFTAEKPKLIGALASLYVEKGQSAVVDGIYLAVKHTAEYRKGTEERRRAVVLFTDGEDRSSFYRDDQLTKLLRETDVQVFVVGMVNLLSKEGGLIRRSPRQAAEELLNRIARESGGRVFYPKDNDELLQVSAAIVQDLHFQYVIGFEHRGKPGEKGFRKVKVKITETAGREPFIVITRPGYLVRVQNSAPNAKEQKSP